MGYDHVRKPQRARDHDPHGDLFQPLPDHHERTSEREKRDPRREDGDPNEHGCGSEEWTADEREAEPHDHEFERRPAEQLERVHTAWDPRRLAAEDGPQARHCRNAMAGAEKSGRRVHQGPDHGPNNGYPKNLVKAQTEQQAEQEAEQGPCEEDEETYPEAEPENAEVESSQLSLLRRDRFNAPFLRLPKPRRGHPLGNPRALLNPVPFGWAAEIFLGSE